MLYLNVLNTLFNTLYFHGVPRHARLVSLLCKLQTMLNPDSQPMLSPVKTHPLAVTPAQVVDIDINKVISVCLSSQVGGWPCSISVHGYSGLFLLTNITINYNILNASIKPHYNNSSVNYIYLIPFWWCEHFFILFFSFLNVTK